MRLKNIEITRVKRLPKELAQKCEPQHLCNGYSHFEITCASDFSNFCSALPLFLMPFLRKIKTLRPWEPNPTRKQLVAFESATLTIELQVNQMKVSRNYVPTHVFICGCTAAIAANSTACHMHPS